MAPAIDALPRELAPWRSISDHRLEKEVVEYLRPEVYLLRDYKRTEIGSNPINLFVAYFASLKTSYGPHSPRVCLPGSGWLVRSSREITVQAGSQSFPVNRYVLEKGKDRILVLYWYQNDRRTWADELYAKLYMLPDLMKHRRSDVTLVRIALPIASGLDGADHASEHEAMAFAQTIHPLLAVKFAETRLPVE